MVGQSSVLRHVSLQKPPPLYFGASRLIPCLAMASEVADRWLTTISVDINLLHPLSQFIHSYPLTVMFSKHQLSALLCLAYYSSVALSATYTCKETMVPVNISAQTTTLNIAPPSNQTELSGLNGQLASLTSNVTTSVSGNKTDLNASYKIFTELCVPDGFKEGGTVQFAIHGCVQTLLAFTGWLTASMLTGLTSTTRIGALVERGPSTTTLKPLSMLVMRSSATTV